MTRKNNSHALILIYFIYKILEYESLNIYVKLEILKQHLTIVNVERINFEFYRYISNILCADAHKYVFVISNLLRFL